MSRVERRVIPRQATLLSPSSAAMDSRNKYISIAGSLTSAKTATTLKRENVKRACVYIVNELE